MQRRTLCFSPEKARHSRRSGHYGPQTRCSWFRLPANLPSRRPVVCSAPQQRWHRNNPPVQAEWWPGRGLRSPADERPFSYVIHFALTVLPIRPWPAKSRPFLHGTGYLPDCSPVRLHRKLKSAYSLLLIDFIVFRFTFFQYCQFNPMDNESKSMMLSQKPWDAPIHSPAIFLIFHTV